MSRSEYCFCSLCNRGFRLFHTCFAFSFFEQRFNADISKEVHSPVKVITVAVWETWNRFPCGYSPLQCAGAIQTVVSTPLEIVEYYISKKKILPVF